MAEKKPSWESAARRAILGDKVDLKSLEGYWIKPRKFSRQGEACIRAAGLHQQQASIDIPEELLNRLAEAYKKRDAGELTSDEFEKLFTTQEKLTVFRSQTEIDSKLLIEPTRLKLLHGIGEHNLNGVVEIGATEDLVNRLIQYPDPCEEIERIVEAHNRPLTQQTSGTSETSPNGSTNDANMSPESPTQTKPGK